MENWKVENTFLFWSFIYINIFWAKVLQQDNVDVTYGPVWYITTMEYRCTKRELNNTTDNTHTNMRERCSWRDRVVRIRHGRVSCDVRTVNGEKHTTQSKCQANESCQGVVRALSTNQSGPANTRAAPSRRKASEHMYGVLLLCARSCWVRNRVTGMFGMWLS